MKQVQFSDKKTVVWLFGLSQFNFDSIQFNNSVNVAKFMNYEQIGLIY